MPRFQVENIVKGCDLFPSRLRPFVRHPEIVALGEDVVNQVLTRACYKWMEDIAHTETDDVGRLCGLLANAHHAVPIPPQARQVALTVMTDEAYHAYAAREFINGVAELTGVLPGDYFGTYGLKRAMSWVENDVPEKDRQLLRIFALCIAENTITAEIMGVAKETAADNPFHIVMKEHMMDEGRHAVFFQNLLEHVWSQLDNSARKSVCNYLPTFLEKYLFEPEYLLPYFKTMLGDSGVPEKIIKNVLAPKQMSQDKRLPFFYIMRNITHLFEKAGMMDHADVRQVVKMATGPTRNAQD